MKLTLPANIESHNLWRPASSPRGRHSGEDYGWRNGDDVFAAADGEVVTVFRSGYNQGWGHRVRIKHAPGVYTTYNHFSPGSIKVVKGQKVKDGDLLGRQGETGLVNGKHLHFELELNGAGAGFRVDPRPYFTKHLPGTEPVTGSPAGVPEKLKAYQRVVRELGDDNWLNGRTDATLKAQVQQRLEPGTTADLDAWKRGQKVTINGVTSDIWFRGKYKKKWFAAAGFTSRSTAGLKHIATILPPKKTKKNYFKTPAEGQYYYSAFESAYHGKYSKKKVLPAGKTYLVVENPVGKGPVKIKVPELGNVWVGTKNHPAKIVKI